MDRQLRTRCEIVAHCKTSPLPLSSGVCRGLRVSLIFVSASESQSWERYFDVGLIKRHSQETTSTNQDDPDEEEGVEDQDDEHWYLQNCEMFVV